MTKNLFYIIGNGRLEGLTWVPEIHKIGVEDRCAGLRREWIHEGGEIESGPHQKQVAEI